MRFTVSQGLFAPVGDYRATLVGIKEMKPHAEYGRSVRFIFRVAGGEHDGAEPCAFINVEDPPSPTNQFGRFLAGLTGTAIVPGSTIDVEQFIGKIFQIQVEDAPNRKGTRVSSATPAF